MAANTQTIKASFGLDIGPLRAAARQAAQVGKQLRKEIGSTLKATARDAEALTGAIAKGLTGGVGLALSSLKKLAITGAALGVVLAAGVHHAYALGRELHELSDRTGIAAGKLLVLRQAFEDAGDSAEDVGPAINKMQKFIAGAAQGSQKAAGVLDHLHLSVAQLQAMTPDQQFVAIGNAIASIPDPALRAAEAMAVFGKSGGKFLSIFGNAGAYGRAADSIGRQAKLLSENAGIFSQVAVSLSHVGLKLQGFFVGVGSRLTGILVPLLDKFEKLDLSGVGEKFGDGLIRGAEFVVGAFKNPQAFIGVAVNALMFGVASAGNLLIAAMKTAKAFFQDGMTETIQGIGDLLLATLVKAFSIPMAYAQAQIEDLLSRVPGQPEYEQRKRAEADVATHSNNAVAMRKLAREASKAEMHAHKTGDTAEAQKQGRLFNYYLGAAEEERKAAFAAQHRIGTPEQRAQSILSGGGPKVSTARGEFTADELASNAMQELNAGLSKTGKKIVAAHVDDVLGARKYGAATSAGLTQVDNQGAGAINKAVAPTPMINGVPVSRAAQAQLIGILGHAKANEIMYSPAQAALLNQASAPKVSPAYYAQLVGMYGSKAAQGMLTSDGRLASNSAPGSAAGSVAASASRVRYAGRLAISNDVQGANGLNHEGYVHSGLGIGHGSAYHVVHRGDAARAKAAAAQKKKEPIQIGGIDQSASKQIASDLAKELEVSD